MLVDTADLLDSDEVKSIAVHCINRGFVLFNDQIAQYYGESNEKIVEVTADFVHPNNVQIPLAKLIPIVNGLFSNKLQTELVQQLIVNDKIKTLGANVYESFSN